MISAKWFMEDGTEVIGGEFSLVTKSLWKAYIDCISLYGGELVLFNSRLKLSIIKVKGKSSKGKTIYKRIVISGGYHD